MDDETKLRALCVELAYQGREGWSSTQIIAEAQRLFDYIITGKTNIVHQA